MGLIIIILILMFLPPILLIYIGKESMPNKKRAKTFYILAIVYLIIGLGTCTNLFYSI